MPRQVQRPRLWLRKARTDATGCHAAVWLIVYRGRYFPTGCAEGETGRADQKLAEYIAANYAPARRAKDIEDTDVADVLSIYVDDKGPGQSNPKRFAARILRLNAFWGGKMLAEVTGATCREYAAVRGNAGGGRRDLEDLRAAIGNHRKQGFHRGLVEVTLPSKGPARDRWLTRGEAARALWVCWRTKEVQGGVETKKYPLRHLVRFILPGLYTGTRAGAIATASAIRKEGRSFVDLERGIFYRLAQGKKATNKRQPPVPIPGRLMVHLRRWSRLDEAARAAGKPGHEHFVEFRGKPVKSVKTAFARLNALLGFEGADRISPHTLRHTAATWLMQQGVALWEAAGFLGMSEKTLRDVYGHHHPEHQKNAARAIGYRKQAERPSNVVALAEALAGTKGKRIGGG